MALAPVVLDASAILAVFHDEPGADLVRACIPDVMASAVNVAEVGAKLLDWGMEAGEIRTAIGGLGLDVVDFDEEAAHASAALREPTRRLGLSLGDRACLALAALRKVPVLTADRSWAGLDIGVHIRLIRGG